MDFVYAVYDRLLSAFQAAQYRGVSIRMAAAEPRHTPIVIVRHDVEWDPRRAWAIAEIDRAHGFSSTLYFRADTCACDLTVMRTLQDQGFGIGYHFNSLDRCRGDVSQAIALFEQELARLREAGIDVMTVKAHGNPRVRKVGYKTNADILEKHPDLTRRNQLLDLRSCLDLHYSDRFPITDVGIRWNPPMATDELFQRIGQREWPVIYLATHPDYWSRSAVRALGLQIAAHGLRCFRINTIVATTRHALNLLRARS